MTGTPSIPRPLRARLRELEPIIWPVGMFVALLGVWELGTITGFISTRLFGSPAGILASAAENLVQASFWTDVTVSSQEFLVGYVAAVLLAIPFGLATGWFRTLHYLFDPILAALNAMPRIALLPIVILWVGLGFWSKAIIVFLGVFFPVAINTFHGVRTVDRGLYDVSRSFGASVPRRFISVVLPSVVPFSLVGMKLGIGRAVSGVVVAEYFASEAGLGRFIFRAGAQLKTSELLFGAIFMTTLAMLALAAIEVLERRVRRWHPASRMT